MAAEAKSELSELTHRQVLDKKVEEVTATTTTTNTIAAASTDD